MLGCLNPDFRRQGMSAKFTIFKCSREMEFEENNGDYYDESLPKDYMGQANILQLRSFQRKRKRLQPCAKSQWDEAIASLENETLKENYLLAPCLEQPDQLVKLDGKKNSTNPLVSFGETVHRKDTSSPSPLGSYFESLPSKPFTVEEEASTISTTLEKIFHDHRLSGDLSLGHEEPALSKISLKTTAGLENESLVFGMPTEGTGMTQESVIRWKTVEDVDPQSAPRLEKMEALLEHLAATVQAKESFDGEALAENLTLKAKKPPLHLSDNLSVINKVDQDSWLLGRVSQEHVDTVGRWNTTTLISNGTLTAAFQTMSYMNQSTPFNRSSVSPSSEGLESKLAVQDMSLETPSTGPLTLEINHGVDDLAPQGYGTVFQGSKSYSSDEVAVQQDKPSMTTELKQPAPLLVSTTTGTQGISTSPSEDSLLGRSDIHTASQEKTHDVHSQDHETEKIMRLRLNEVMGDTRFLKEPNALFAQNGDGTNSERLTGNLSITDNGIDTNDILNSNGSFSTNPSHRSQETKDLRFQGDPQEGTHGKYISGREKEASSGFYATPNEISIPNSQRVLGKLVKQNVTQHRLAEAILKFPKGSVLGGKYAVYEESAPPSQLIKWVNETGSEERVRKRRSELDPDVHRHEKSAEETKKTTCPLGLRACGGRLKKRSLELHQVPLEGTAAIGARLKNSSDVAEGQAWASLNGGFFRTSSNATAGIIRKLLGGNTTQEYPIARPGHSTVSISPPSNSIQYNLSRSLNILGSQADSAQIVTQDESKQAGRGGSSPQKIVDAGNINIVPGYSTNETTMKGHGTETQPGVDFTVEGEIAGVHIHLQKNTEKIKEGGLPATSEVPSTRQADQEGFFKLQLQDSNSDLQDATKREEVEISATQDPVENDLLHQDHSAINQTLPQQPWVKTEGEREIRVFEGEEGNVSPSAFQRKKEEEENDGIQRFNKSKSTTPGNTLNVEVPLIAYNSSRAAEANSSKRLKETSDYDDYSNTEENLKEFDIYGEDDQDPRGFTGKVRQYYIAAVEVIWDYGSHIPSPFLRDQ